MKTRKVLHLFLSPIIFVAMQSCEQNGYLNNSEDCANYNYSDCNPIEPTLAALNIKLSINSENTKVPLTIYEGKIEDNNIVLTDTATSKTYSILLTPDKYYTVSARYVSGDKIIFAIDGDKVKKIQNQVCDSICWSVQEGNVNVELR